MPNSTKTPAIDVKDPRFFYTDSYVDYLVAECIDEFYNKSWLRSIEAQKGKVNSRVKMISIGIDDEINRRYGYPILNGRAFEPTDVLVGKYEGNLFPYYNKKEFLDRYGYDKEIPLRALLTDTEIFSMRLNVVTFDGYSEFEGVYFIAQRDGTSLIVMKDPKSITKYFWKKKMIDKDPVTQLTIVPSNPLFGPKASGSYKPNDEDFTEYLNSHFFLRVFTEPHGSVYFYNGLAQNLVSKVQYQGKPCVGIPINKLEEILHIEKPNDTNAYSLYIGYETNGVFMYILNGSILFQSNGYMIFPGNQYVDDLIPEMASSTLTTKITLYIFDEYQKIGTESVDVLFSTSHPYSQGTIPYRKNISHPDNIRCYRKNVADFYQSRLTGNVPFAHQKYTSITNTPHSYWQYNGLVSNPGNSIADMGEEVILSYMKAYDKLRPTEAFHRTDKGLFISEQYRDEVFTCVPDKQDASWLGYIHYPNIYNPSKWNTALGVYNVFGQVSPWYAYLMTIDYYEADPEISATEWLNPYEYVIKYSSDFTRKFLSTEASKVDAEAKKQGIADWRGNLLWKWNYDFDDYVNSIHYGNLRAYQLSKFAELCHNNQALYHTYLNRVNEKKWQVRSYTIDFDEIKARRSPVTDTRFIHPNPEDRYHFDKPQYWVEFTTTDTFGRFIEVFVNGAKIKTNLSCVVNYTNYLFFDADLIPDKAKVIVDMSRKADGEFENKRTGSFTLTSTNVPIPFPSGFGKVQMSDLIFYNKETGEILDINDLGLQFTEKKDQFEVENMIGEVENVVTTPGLADISYLRTNAKEFYKTTDIQKIILSTSRVDIPIPTTPEPPYLPNTEADMDDVVVSTDNLNGLNIEIGVTTTDNHFVHYQQVDKSHPSGSFEIPNWQEYGYPSSNTTDAATRLTQRFRCYFNGELMSKEFFNVSGPYHPTNANDKTYVGGKLKVDWKLPPEMVWTEPIGEIVVEYIPYRITDLEEMVYPSNTHPSGPYGSLKGGYQWATLTTLLPGTIVFGGGRRISNDRMHMISKNNTDLFYFDHVPSGASLNVTTTGSEDLINLIKDPLIDLTPQNPADGPPNSPAMDLIPDWPFMMGDLNQYTYQEANTSRVGSVDVYDMTDFHQWSIAVNTTRINFDERRKITRVLSPTRSRVLPHIDGVYNYRMSIVDDSSGHLNPDIFGYYTDDPLYGIDPCYPLDSRLLTNDYDSSTALPLNIRGIAKIDRTKNRQFECFETLVIYRKGHPLKLVFPKKVYNSTLDMASLTLTAISQTDEDLYEKYKAVYQLADDTTALSPWNAYASILPVSDIATNDMTLTDDLVFKYIRGFSKWIIHENTPIVVKIRGVTAYEGTPAIK